MRFHKKKVVGFLMEKNGGRPASRTGKEPSSSRQITGTDQRFFLPLQNKGRSLPCQRLHFSGTFKVFAYRQAEIVIFVDFTVVFA
jgi:hypothetical protein